MISLEDVSASELKLTIREIEIFEKTDDTWAGDKRLRNDHLSDVVFDNFCFTLV